jgi:hypothetical protein
MKRNMKIYNDLSRRDFIKTTAIGIGTSAMVGLDTKESNAKKNTPAYKWHKEADVVVVGYGGARRNGKAQILDPDRKPILRLYSAGSFGSVMGRIYSVFGGNMAELCAFGRIAGRNAAAEKSWSWS